MIKQDGTEYQESSHQQSKDEEKPQEALEHAVVAIHVAREVAASGLDFPGLVEDQREVGAHREQEALVRVVVPGQISALPHILLT